MAEIKSALNPGEGTTTTPSQNFQRITSMLKSKSVKEWLGQHPSYDNFPVLVADNSKTGGKKGDDTQQKVMARHVASNIDKIIGHQMAADTVIIQMLEEIKAENRSREQMFQEAQNQIGSLENSHAELVEAIQGLRRDLNSKKDNCRCNEEVSTQRVHNIKIESEESFNQSNFFENSQPNQQNMSANTSSYAGADEKIEKDIQKNNKSLKDNKVTKNASELHQK